MQKKESSSTKPLKQACNPLAPLPPLGMDAEAISYDFRRCFAYTLGRVDHCASRHYLYKALAFAIRDRLIERWKMTRTTYEKDDCKRTFYLSLEFLMGRTLSNAIFNLDVTEEVSQVFMDLDINLDDIRESEPDAGLGNGGLGRLAACFLDSCATLQLPVRGYGLRYEYGMFRQHIANGQQIEDPDHWLRDGNPWELERQEYTQRIKFCGHTEYINGSLRWMDTQDVLAVPYDLPIPGYRNGTVNTLRLWKAAATDEFNLEEFNAGSYTEAVEAKNDAEHITMVLYPNDASENGKELRLRQQYFLASASLKDVIREWKESHSDFDSFTDKNCFQLNDTHPSISIAELMRQLMDEQGFSWDKAWHVTSSTMAYTNHTLLPEALERWPIKLFKCLLPRLLEIIYEINARFLGQVASRWPGDTDRLRRMSIIKEGEVRMAYLAIVGSFSINGVAALHTELLKQRLFQDFFEFWPERFNNKTNGVTPRRWLAASNHGLRKLIDETVGNGWISDLPALEKLASLADNSTFQRKWQKVKTENKQHLAKLVKADCNVVFDADALFDVQVKRIHEYKRQLLNILHVIHLYNRIKAGDTENWIKRCVLIGGKAAPGYQIAKLIIKLINSVARVVNNDCQVGHLLKVAFLPNYRVTSMEVIAPGTDLSEQISTAGKEASGTGNMKFMMNGAVTIGTLDGANIEILEEVGEANFFLFGLSSEKVEAMRAHYMPNNIIEQDSDLKRVMQLLESGYFNQFEPGIFDPIIESIRNPYDPWMTAADFRGYQGSQEQAAIAYQDQKRWTRMSILNSAKSGRFSSDRTIQEYNHDIWKLKSVVVPSINESGQ
ncbi:MAG: glycogen/starch/alpha-glucan phosphorylase [Candidatus Thiodiazotropha sp. (ex Lucinoma aequizonata)]|nr:glycogen/starch/alpha-glucan phosphorylase [Candidatus Thiodiazotropha sp. (ex Lucinoma aequizonata)]MCU7887203.1 glycogen/starch/alpha-glucan phosphorylase [Candidatus Thiodiazotropha sp. (ex Lucinoma aequizonata)]MCU7894348.1 glycogen/starch/alpha-glucan phosphorylase [Candidatus Thiodiazotropha sp. (ex Lucinoma aequizonata)]MCU7899418.1 glycogen/starch/alpha-glucan phosphorylase [Candidatus Thiodiazotropha sp. (ex Lucinoma aequizonata)]MCU7904169.1 glycogen/starch/alpha-glucan phosphoryla